MHDRGLTGNPAEADRPEEASRQLASKPLLIEEAGRCVACGLCLPHCPTYRKTLSEADSPRGRIALMRGVLEERIPLSDRFIEHIDLCLTCRACENACPNTVPYGQLVDGVRVFIEEAREIPPFPPFIKGGGGGIRSKRGTASALRRLRTLVVQKLTAYPALLEKLAPWVRFYQRSGLQAGLRKSRLLARLGFEEVEAQLPAFPSVTRWREVYPAQGKQRGEVGLFLGCIARVTDSVTLRAAVFVLNRLGYTVHVPWGQTCCGALHQHSGNAREAARLAAENLKAFERLGFPAIITTASGCGAHLSEYHVYHGHAALAFSAKVVDISTYLNDVEGWDTIEIAPLSANIRVHDPCTLRNVMRRADCPYTLLKRIPQAKVEPLPGNDQCCGAAGTYFLTQPEMAKRLLDDKMKALQTSGPQYLATSNAGCAMYLASGLQDAGSGIELLHPVTLLARQMGFGCK